ncbi:hypothetical protein ACFVFH_02040 [Streptomyces sp. NPDC057697]|uniref:hypothetical protein n=1 Tax=Streptomyces sp. NPDC057697 TaxID=3346219 RepID=UPI0036AA531B
MTGETAGSVDDQLGRAIVPVSARTPRAPARLPGRGHEEPAREPAVAGHRG